MPTGIPAWFLLHRYWGIVTRPAGPRSSVEAQFAALQQSLGDVDWAYCPHDAGPPVCWCRKPIPGQLIEFAVRRRVDLTQSIVVGSSSADRTMAERVGARLRTALDHAGG